MSTVFTAVNWTPMEVLGADKMKTIDNNTKWLAKNSLRGVHQNGTDSKVQTSTGLRLLSGACHISPNKDSDTGTARVEFNGYFSSGCLPNIVTGVSSGQSAIQASIKGIGKDVPDSVGFECRVNVTRESSSNSDYLKGVTRVHWFAMGY